MVKAAMATLAVMADRWLFTIKGTVHTPAACKIAKLQSVKPAVEKILNAGNVKQQAAVLRAVENHPALAAACKIAEIDSSKEQAAAKYVCEQSAWMLGRACSDKKAQRKTEREKRNATKVVLTLSAPSPNRVTVGPNRCKRTHILGIAPSTLDCVNNAMIKKQQQLTVGERGIYWALAK